MCFVFISEQTATCATYSINWLVFMTEMKSVYSAVGTESLNKAVCASSLKGQIDIQYSFSSHNTWAIKSKVHPRSGHEGPDKEYRYSSTLSLTLALNVGGCSTPCSGHFTPGKETRYPFYRRLGGPQGRSGRVRKTSLPQGAIPTTLSRSTYVSYRHTFKNPV
jgi:hypothetical protein